jgi:threonine dehydrogenase-like Zn-dependent dehydrogenase
MLRGMFDYEFPVTLGRDFAGTVEATGAGVEGYAEGDGVFGVLVHADPTVHAGTWSELMVTRADGFVAHKPENVGLARGGGRTAGRGDGARGDGGGRSGSRRHRAHRRRQRWRG